MDNDQKETPRPDSDTRDESILKHISKTGLAPGIVLMKRKTLEHGSRAKSRWTTDPDASQQNIFPPLSRCDRYLSCCAARRDHC